MKQQTRFPAVLRVSALIFVAALLPTERAVAQADYAWEMLCSGVVKPIPKKLKRPQDGDVFRLEDSIKLCTKHVYSFTGKAGQRLDLQLTGSDGVSMFLFWKDQQSPEHPALFYMQRKWEGELPTDGKYTLTVVTQKDAAKYEVQLKVD